MIPGVEIGLLAVTALCALLNWRTQRGHYVLLTKQAKAMRRDSQLTRLEATRAIEQAQHAERETQLIQERLHRILQQPAFRQALDEE